MTYPPWRSVVLVALFLLQSFGAQAQGRRLSSRVIRERYPAAAGEIARSNPALARTLRALLPAELGDLREEIGPDHVAAILTEQLKSRKLALRLEERDQGSVLSLSPLRTASPAERTTSPRLGANDRLKSVLGRALLSVMRRDEILKEIGATEGATLEVQRQTGQELSELESYLKDRGVTDYRQVARSFDANAEVKEIILPKATTLLRLYGGSSQPVGRYLFCCLETPTAAALAMLGIGDPLLRWTDASGLATPPENMEQDLAVVTLPEGTRALAGPIADYFRDAAGRYRPGGNTQIFLPDPVPFRFDRYPRATDGAEPWDIMLLKDDRVLRFRRSR